MALSNRRKHKAKKDSDESSDSDEHVTEEDSQKPSRSRNSNADPRFHQPTPSPWKRLALILFLIFLFWAGFKLRGSLLEAKRKPKIIHATRYSKEFKFRPAASPVLTETLKDGRIRLRGAPPEPTAIPTEATRPKKKSGTVKKRKQKRKRTKK